MADFQARSQNCEERLLASSYLFVPHVLPFSGYNSAVAGLIFMEFDIWLFFRKLGEKIQVLLKFEKNNEYVTWRPIYVFDHLPLSFLEWEMFRTKFVEKIKTHILCSITFVENRAFYEITWKNILELDRPRMTIWLMRIACWIPKSANTLRMCITYRFFSVTVVVRKRFSVTLYVLCLYSLFLHRCCVI